MLSYEELVDRVAEEGGFSSRETAEDALRATLEVLGSHLEPMDVAQLERQLPAEVGTMLRRHRYAGSVELEHFYREVGAHERVRAGFAIEHAQVVCRIVAHSVSAEARQHLTVHLPQSMHELFDVPEHGAPPLQRVRGQHVEPGTGHTLSTGRQGSHHPLSESRPHGQHHSVAESDDPHADTKLSSSRGPSQERRGDTLATGVPGSKRPLSESED